ncbi:hypothetical protein Tco_0483340 [Tanacetum coccineum]
MQSCHHRAATYNTSIYTDYSTWRFQWVSDDEPQSPEAAPQSPEQAHPSPDYVPGLEHPPLPDYYHVQVHQGRDPSDGGNNEEKEEPSEDDADDEEEKASDNEEEEHPASRAAPLPTPPIMPYIHVSPKICSNDRLCIPE